MGTSAHVLTPCRPTCYPLRFFSLAAAKNGGWAAERWHWTDTGRIDCCDESGLSPDRWWDYLRCHLSRRGATWVYCWGLRDALEWLRLGQHVDSSDMFVDSYVDASHVGIVGVRCAAGRALFCDMSNYGLPTVQKCAEQCGIEHAEIEMMQPDDGDIVDLLYARRELVTATVERMLTLAGKWGLGGWRSTVGQLGWHAWRVGYCDGSIHVHADKSATYLERKSYCGGRADCHVIGPVSGGVIRLDRNSLYPHCATVYPLPVRLVSVEQLSAERLQARLAGGYGVIAHVYLHTPDREYPYTAHRPVRHARGDYWTTLAGPELARALQTDSVVATGMSATYEMGSPLSSYMLYMHRQRMLCKARKDHIGAAFAKALMVALIGRFAAYDHRHLPCPRVRAIRRWGTWTDLTPGPSFLRRYLALAGNVFTEIEGGESEHSCVALGSYVHSHGRMLMDKAKQIAGETHVYYEDTDSIHVDQMGFDALVEADMISGTQLGKLRVDGTADTAEYRGIRDYALGSKVVQAGSPRRVPRAVPGCSSTTMPTQEHRYYRGRVGDDGRVSPLVIDEPLVV